MRCSTFYSFFALTGLLICSNLLFSQTISYQNPTEFFVCGEAPFEVTVSNTSTSPIQDVTVALEFLTNGGIACGMIYAAGTVNGASEADISNLEKPVFRLNDLAAGASQTFTFTVQAPCEMVDCIDNGAVFQNKITLAWSGGNFPLTTDPYVVERALLIITAVNSTVMSGSLGEMLLRKITIRNTRPGAIEGFIFKDIYQPGISVSSVAGQDISPGGDVLQLFLSGSDFSAVGDGDELFELNESIVIEEKILVTDCGFDLSSSVSNLSVGWGCGAEICQESFINAVVIIKLTQNKPTLIWEPITSVSECFCGPNGYRQGMKITNVGTGAANDLALQIAMYFPASGAIDTASITVDSMGQEVEVKTVFFGVSELTSPCVAPGAVTGAFIATLSKLSPGASVTIYWDVYFCDDFCNQPAVFWRYKYSYYKDCPPAPFIQLTDYINVMAAGNFMDVSLSSSPSANMIDGDTITASYQLTYDSLTLLDHELTIDIQLPCGMIWLPENELLLNGQAPVEITTQPIGTTALGISATYQLPLNANIATMQFDFVFDCDSLCGGPACRDSLQSTCILDTCTIGLSQLLAFQVSTTLMKCDDFPAGCNMQSCTSRDMHYDCEIDSVCIHAPPGYVKYSISAERKNFGLPDNDNNRLPDAAGTLDMSLIRKDRLIAGDIIQARLAGEVIVDDPSATLSGGGVQIAFSTFQLGFANSSALLSDTGLVQVGVYLRIFDKSENAWYECFNLPPVLTDDIRFVFDYDLSALALAGCVPAGFAYEHGDSILFEGLYRIEYNIKRDPDPNPLLGYLYIRPSFFVAGDAGQDTLDCDCKIDTLEVSGYEYSILPGIIALPPCDPSLSIGGSLLKLDLEMGNFFPFEYRNLLTALDWQFEIPADVGLTELKLVSLNYQGVNSPPLNQVLTPVFSNGTYSVGLTQFQNPPLDEGFSMFFQYIFDALCTISGSNAMTVTSHLDFVPGLPEAEDPLALSIEANSLRALIPNLLIDAVLSDLISFNNQLVYDFTLTNFKTVVASQMSGAAPNTWLYVTSPTGKVVDFQLINLTTGQPVPSVNGVFQLGNFPVDSVSFRLLGLNNSCSLENLQIHYGWNCTPFNSQFQAPCYEQVKPLSILSPPGEIDMFITSPPTCSELCDTVDFHTIQIFNAQLGAVYNLTLTALVPPGFSVLSGSCEVEYPSGSGNFIPIADPLLLNNGVVQWKLTELLAAIETGLPGVSFAPDNSLTLRFLGETNCDFIANSYLLFVIAAELNCGILSNTIAKPGLPLCIEGVSAPFATNINVQAEPGFGCNDEVTFEVSLTSSATLPPGTCLIVNLPQGISFVPGSCESVCQTNFNCNPTISGNTLTWQLPAGTPSNQVVCFNFTTTGWSSLGCENGVVLFRSAAETQAICATTGNPCSAKVSTGSLIFPYVPMRPAFELNNFTINASQSGTNDVVNFSVDITNNGATNEPPLVLDFYLDTNGDGSGDQLVFTKNYNETLSNGETETLTGSFTLPGGNLCNLLAYVDPDDQCACAGDSIAATFPIEYDTEQMPVVCSGTAIQIGVTDSIPIVIGIIYQWSPVECLSCETCSLATFDCINDTGVPVEYHFVLTQSKGSCVIENLIDLTLQPVPGILFADSPICIGETANLVATDGVSYNWQGADISMPNLQVQSVTPSVTSDFSVTVTDTFGCIGMETVTVVVNPLPNADAGVDAIFCPGGVAQLNAFFDSNYEYLWSPASIGGAPALSNPAIFNPIVLTNQSTVFSLTVTDETSGCTNTDAVSVSFDTTFILIPPPDVTICAGTSTTLTAGGALTYEWSPGGICEDPPACSMLTVSPSQMTIYTVIATDSAGCKDSAQVTVTVTTDLITSMGAAVEICEGGSATLFGEAQTAAGIYCSDTIQLASGCDSVHCIELIVKPLIDTMFFADTICEGETLVFEDTILSETGPFCKTYPGTNNCDSTLCINLVVRDTPEVEIIALDTVFLGNTIDLSISPNVFDSIIWAGGNIDTGCINLPECLDSLLEIGMFTYTVTVVGSNGCAGVASKTVVATVECEPEKVEVPNIFTPNNDSVNDTFAPVSPASEIVLSMKIWNRWGQKVYDGIAPWDGRQDGKGAESDVYVYLIRVGCPVGVEGEERVLKGDVTLVR